MRPLLCAVAAISLLASCGREVAVPAAEKNTAPVPAAATKDNLLVMARGASVLSRTAEMTLEQTPARLIDGEPESHWTTPPGDIQQSCVLTLPAPARITSFGAGTFDRKPFAAKTVRIETSLDGTKYSPATTLTLTPKLGPQMKSVTPVEAQYVRVSIDENHGGPYAALTSIDATGQFLRAPLLPDVAGCWAVNGAPALLERSGNAVRGTLMWEGLLQFDGGADDAYYRFAWADGPYFGFAAITLTPDGRHFTGMKWHERAEPLTFGTNWFAERAAGCPAQKVDPDAVARLWLRRTSYFPLYGLRFDAHDRLVVSESELALQQIARIAAKSQRIKLTANELRAASPEASRTRTDARIASLRAELARRGLDQSRIDYVSAGSDNPPARLPSDLILGMLSVVDIRVAGSSF